ncbi:glycosyltransferase family 2 protein [Aquamicrobium soli]|uniref:Glycosyltransferase family 2 protein n=1 Tax=Aquamicrobium soli TaxID=1811518 RepID=A0ABV7KH82_9HYPH
MSINLPDVTVVVLSYNRKDQLQKTVAHLLGITERTGCELIIVDNASTDGCMDEVRPMVQGRINVRLIENDRNAGVSEGRNIGWRAASRNFILSMDDDILISEYDILEMLDLAQRNRDAGIVSPDIVDTRTGRTLNGGSIEVNGCASFFYEGCFLISRAAISDIGYLDAILEVAGEGMDYSLRLRAAGYKIRRSHAVKVGHVDRARSNEESIDRRKRWLWSFSYLYWKNLRPPMALLRTCRNLLSHAKTGLALFGPSFVLSLPMIAYRGAVAGYTARLTNNKGL